MNHLTNKPCLAQARIFSLSLLLALLSLPGCGTSTYGEAVKKSLPELERRGKFAALGPDYFRFPTFPIAYRVPKMFLDDDIVKQRWTSAKGQAVKLTSKDPYELKIDPEFKGGIRPEFAIPPEFKNATIEQAHQGTYLCEYKVTVLSEPGNPGSGTDTQQSFMMSIWMFDTSPQSRIKPPNDTALLAMVKAQGKAPAKSGVWEEDIIDMLSTPDNPSPASITAKLARFPITSKFMVGRDMNRTLVEKKGLLRLWSFRLDNKYQVYLALRISSDLAEGETPEFPQDVENPNADRLLDLGRAVIGTMSVVADVPAEGEAKKK